MSRAPSPVGIAPPASVRIVARAEFPNAIVEIHDAGRAIGTDLRDRAFTIAGQHQLKGRGDGRYGRVAGLLAAHVLALAVGATIEVDGRDGAAVFRITMRRLSPGA